MPLGSIHAHPIKRVKANYFQATASEAEAGCQKIGCLQIMKNVCQNTQKYKLTYMSGKSYASTEKKVLDLFLRNKGKEFEFAGRRFRIGGKIGKPRPAQGECKTDCYVELEELTGNPSEALKISIKQPNADFTGNKTSAETAENELGEDWSNIILHHTFMLKEIFLERPIMYKYKKGRIEGGSMTLGWKFEFMNKKSGYLSGKIDIDAAIHYKGENLPESKRNSKVEGKLIENSGVANRMLVCSAEELSTLSDITNKIVSIEEYAEQNPDLFFACKALNCRTLHEDPFKYDGDRPLAVQVAWKANAQTNSLQPFVVFNRPLVKNGKEMRQRLINALNELGCSNTSDLDEKSVRVLNPKRAEWK